MKGFISLNELKRSGRIDWANSAQAIKVWVLRDKLKDDILKAVYHRDPLKRSGKWYIPVENIDAFIKAFKEGNL